MAPQHSSTSLVSVDEENIDNVSIIRSAKGMEKNSKSLMAKANEMVVQLMGMSNMTSDDNEVTIPRFRTEEIKTGRVLGRGGFCIVKQLHEIRLRVLDDDRLSVRCGSTNRWSIRDGKGGTCSDDDDASSTGFGGAARSTISRWNRRRRNKYISTGSLASASIEQGERGKYPRRVSGSSSICSSSIIGGGSCRFDAFSTALDLNSREYIARRSRVQKGERYVVKIVDPKLKETDKTHYLKGIVDLSMEAQFLSSLDHPNIISLRGLCAAFPYQNVIQMIILDNLPEIFNQRLNTWMQAYRTTRGITGFVTRGRRRAKDLLTDRLIVGYDIARAMEYIHSKNIVYRDLVRSDKSYRTIAKFKFLTLSVISET
jgi:serine/threonine protein kinase